jgi:hypothetical protein
MQKISNTINNYKNTYVTRRPEKTILYDVIRKNIETFLNNANSSDYNGIPKFIKNEFRSYLQCGIHAYGFLRLKCEDCKKEKNVAFSCNPYCTPYGRCVIYDLKSDSYKYRPQSS